MSAVTYTEYSERAQTVHNEASPRYYGVIKRLKTLISYPVSVDASFKVRGEHFVYKPGDAFRSPIRTEVNVWLVGNSLKNTDQVRGVDRGRQGAIHALDSLLGAFLPCTWPACS